MVSRRLGLLALGMLIPFLLSATASAQNAVRGSSEYLEALTSLSSGQLDPALTAINKAVAADDENASYHTARAVVLYLQGKALQAADDIDRAMKLGATPATQVWGWAVNMQLSMPPSDDLDPAARQQAYQRQRRMPQFDSRPPYESKEPYARSIFEPAMHLATPIDPAQQAQYKQQIIQAAAEYAWNEMSSPGLAPSIMNAAKSLFDQKKFAQCLSLLDRLREKTPSDPQLLVYSAGCKLQLGDFESARSEYTAVLTRTPQDVNSLLGRAQAAANMSAIQRANADLAIAAGINSAAADAWKKANAALLERAQANLPRQSLDQLMSSLKQAAADPKQPMTAVIDQAVPLMRAVVATRFVPAEAYTDELQRLDAAASADPRNADKQAALGEFLVNPTVVRPVRIPGKTGNARIPVGDADVNRAQPPLDRALAMNPNHINAITQKALSAVATHQPNVAIQWVQKALDLGANNLDLSKIHLDYYTSQANSLSSEAYSLRQPKSHNEYRGNAEYLVTVYPSPADLARADELDRQSADLRRKAVAPMQKFAESKKGTIEGHLADAEIFQWSGKYDQAIASAEAAIKLDPWQLDAHEFLVDLCPKVNMMDLAIQHQDLLNNLMNPSAGRTLDRVWELLAATKYRSAKETIDAAEKIELSSVYVPAYRSAVAQAERKSDELYPAVRQALAMEEGKQRVSGRTLDANSKTPLSTTDAGLTLALRRLWASDLRSSGKAMEASEQYVLGIRVAQRVPMKQWDTQIQATALPAEQDAKPKGWTVRELLLDMEFGASHTLLDAGKPDDAARALMAYIGTFGRNDMPPGAMDYGYEIYQKLGQQKSAQYFTSNMMGYYQMKDGQAENRAILQRGDEIQARYEKRIEEIRQRQQDLQQQMQTAQRARNTAQMRSLQQQQQQLNQELSQAIRDMNLEQMRNIDPNQGSGR